MLNLMVSTVTFRFKGLKGRGEFVTKLLSITVGMSGLCSTLRCICVLLRNLSVNQLKHTGVSVYCLL
jgi:hypothetical protein